MVAQYPCHATQPTKRHSYFERKYTPHEVPKYRVYFHSWTDTADITSDYNHIKISILLENRVKAK